MCAKLFANNTSVLLSMMIHEDEGRIEGWMNIRGEGEEG